MNKLLLCFLLLNSLVSISQDTQNSKWQIGAGLSGQIMNPSNYSEIGWSTHLILKNKKHYYLDFQISQLASKDGYYQFLNYYNIPFRKKVWDYSLNNYFYWDFSKHNWSAAIMVGASFNNFLGTEYGYRQLYIAQKKMPEYNLGLNIGFSMTYKKLYPFEPFMANYGTVTKNHDFGDRLRFNIGARYFLRIK